MGYDGVMVVVTCLFGFAKHWAGLQQVDHLAPWEAFEGRQPLEEQHRLEALPQQEGPVAEPLLEEQRPEDVQRIYEER